MVEDNQNNTKTKEVVTGKNNTQSLFGTIIGIFLRVITIIIFLFVLVLIYILGLVNGYELASRDAEASISQILTDYANKFTNVAYTPTPTPSVKITPTITNKKITWGGPDLWEAVNKRRVELGVNPINSRSDLCTIASIRLNELLELGNLDGHEGFTNMSERRPDLKKIFERYSTVAEFLAMGGETATETVKMWENTLGHSQLLKGGEYVWGCIYAQDSFAVAITAF